LGSTVKDSSGTQYILSNNHVLALFNTGMAGDAITQPDCAVSQDTVAHLSKYVTLSTTGANPVDAAMAKVVPGDVSTNDNILNVGSVSSATSCILDAYVEKQGCATGLTLGQVLGCDQSLTLTDNCTGNQYTFVFQEYVLGNAGFIAGGDSGSLLVSRGTPVAMGLIFAMTQSGYAAYANPMLVVLEDLGVSMAAPSGVTPQSAAVAPSAQQIAAAGVVDKYAPDFMKIPGVWGVGDRSGGHGHITITIMADNITPGLGQAVPPVLGDFPTAISLEPRPEFASRPGCTRRDPPRGPNARATDMRS
jgi:hypothetical protein